MVHHYGIAKYASVHLSQRFYRRCASSAAVAWYKQVSATPKKETTLQGSVSLRRTFWTKSPNYAAEGYARAGKSKNLDPDKVIGYKTPPIPFTYTRRDGILYALGVGAKVGQRDYLKFLYEGSDNFSILPTYAALVGQVVSTEPMLGNTLSGLKVHLENILHGEQYLEVYKPLPPSGNLSSVLTVIDILDKRSGALLIADVHTRDESGELMAYNQLGFFEVGAGKFGGKKHSDNIKPTVAKPSRPPDKVMEETTSPSQAAIYRLSGDYNALHIDPEFSAKGGQPIPILHGLCTFGHAARHVLYKYAGNDVTRFKAMKVRFTNPVLPGQTIQTEMWKEGNRIHIQCRVLETEDICISGAYVDLKPE